MQYGMFMQPAHPPERSVYDGVSQDVEEIVWLDELGFSEVWVGEHISSAWEPYPAGDLIIAQALPRTENIKICSGGYIPTFYHPAALAFRICQLDHMAQGRYMLGIASGSLPPDLALLNLDPAKGEHREAAYEALELMIRLWTDYKDTTWEENGKYWKVANIGKALTYEPHLEPYQKPHPPIAMAGLSPGSASIAYAGARGYIPLSVFFSLRFLKTHWQTYVDAADEAGLSVDRSVWRVNRDIFVGETDEEARDYVRNGLHARIWRETHLPAFLANDWTKFLKHDDSVEDHEVDIEYLIEHLWVVGSPDTVKAKLQETVEELGPFGTVLSTKYDYLDQPEAYRRGLELLANEVMPAFADVCVPEEAA